MEWIRVLEEQTGRFAEVLGSGDLSAPVPACPGWTLADLGEHLRSVHTWAAHAVTDGSPDGHPPPGPLDREGLVAGYRAAADHLLDVLRRTPPEEPAWTFGPDKVAGFWHRRQVHEVTVHLHDALASQGRATDWSIPAELAWDGVAEVVTLFYPRQVRLGRIAPLAAGVRLVATDLATEPLVLGGEAGGEAGGVAGGGAGGGIVAAELRAAASDLLLALWKRRPVGDPAVRELLAVAVTP